MSSEETMELAIPTRKYKEYAKWAKKLGYESVDAFIEKAIRDRLEQLKRKVGEEQEET